MRLAILDSQDLNNKRVIVEYNTYIFKKLLVEYCKTMEPGVAFDKICIELKQKTISM